MLYVAALKDMTLVKLGYTRRPPIERLNEQLAVYPTDDWLVLLAVTPGNASDERQLHKRFSSTRIQNRREWFYWSPALAAWIRETRAVVHSAHNLAIVAGLGLSPDVYREALRHVSVLSTEQQAVLMGQKVPRCLRCGHHEDFDLTAPSAEAGRLVCEEQFSFVEAGRRVGINHQAAYQGWKRYVKWKAAHAGHTGHTGHTGHAGHAGAVDNATVNPATRSGEEIS